MKKDHTPHSEFSAPHPDRGVKVNGSVEGDPRDMSTEELERSIKELLQELGYQKDHPSLSPDQRRWAKMQVKSIRKRFKKLHKKWKKARKQTRKLAKLVHEADRKGKKKKIKKLKKKLRKAQKAHRKAQAAFEKAGEELLP